MKIPLVLIVARNERAKLFRSKTIRVLASLLWLLIAFAALTGWQRYRLDTGMKMRADSLFLHEWEHQEANPHSAAHFGTYLFKPVNVLAAYEPGLNTYLGVSYRVEAHVQHEPDQAAIQDSAWIPRFGEYSLSMLLLLLVPLFILCLTHNSISGERDGGTLTLLELQGVKNSEILVGKAWGYFSVIGPVVLIPLLLLSIPVWPANSDILLRYGLLVVGYLLYSLIFTLLGIFFSASLKNANSALGTGLFFWVIMTIAMPKLVAGLAGEKHTLPSRYEFSRLVQEAYQKGVENDGSASERYEKYLDEILSRYGVDSVEKLPLNFDGLAMQFSEDYYAKVYTDHLATVEQMLDDQAAAMGNGAFLNPFLAMQQLSMGLAGTDLRHHLAFYHDAKAYRDNFIRTLNLDLAHSGSGYLSYSYKAPPDFYRKMEKFTHKLPPIRTILGWQYRAVIALIVWSAVAAAMLWILSVRKRV